MFFICYSLDSEWVMNISAATQIFSEKKTEKFEKCQP